MKKLLLSSIVVVALLSTSCKKDRTCTCTTSGSGLNATSSYTIKETKKKAKDACEAYQTSSSVSGLSITTTCTLD
jgi:hypothetical protein